MKQLHKDRLLKLAEHLERIPNKKFNLSSWIQTVNGPANQNGFTKHSCGTAACAVGYLPVVFPKYFEYNYLDSYSPRLRYKTKAVLDLDGFFGATHFFGLSEDQAFNLFMPSNYPRDRQGKTSVARRIRDFVNNPDKYDGHIPINTGIRK